MDLISWSLNTIDQIFATRKMAQGESSCPDGTFAAGYIIDSWETWRVMCLSILSVEDVEDAYIFGFMLAGFLLIGFGGYLQYRKNQRMQAALLGHSQTMLTAIRVLDKLPVIEGKALEILAALPVLEKLPAIEGQNQRILSAFATLEGPSRVAGAQTHALGESVRELIGLVRKMDNNLEKLDRGSRI